MPKYYKTPKPKDNELNVLYGRSPDDGNPDICYTWGKGTARADSRLLHNVFSGHRFRPGSYDTDPSLYDELEKRGYDLTTLRFSIKKKLPSANTQEP